MVLFYVVLTPIWLGLRALAWVAELRSRAGGTREGVHLGRRAKARDAVARKLSRVLVLPPAVVPQREEDQRVATPEHVAQGFAVAVPELLAEHDAPYGPPQESRHPDPPRQVEPDDRACGVHRQVPELQRYAPSITQPSPATIGSTSRRSSSAGSSRQPAWWWMASSSKYGTSRSAASCRPRVDFPLPLADEMIVTRFTTTTLSPAHRIRAVRLVYAFDEEAPGPPAPRRERPSASRR